MHTCPTFRFPRILLSLITIASVAALGFAATQAFFSDTEKSSANTFTAGRLDLKINGRDNPEAIINISDLKPGDNQIVNKTLFIDNNPAKVYLHLKDLEASQGAQTEPEELEENGEPKSDLENYLTYDLLIGENALIALSDSILLSDVVSCWIPLGEILGATDVILQQSFHFDASVTNWAQGDTLTFTEEFYAVQSHNNPNPVLPDLGTNRYWNSQTKKCEELEPIATLSIPANSSQDTTSTHTSEDGAQYRIKALGTANAGDTIEFDAKYSITNRITGDSWTDTVTGYESYGPTLLDLMVNGGFVDWGAYNSSHVYWYETLGNGNKFTFKIYDVYYPNNTGSLTVEIYKLP